MRCLRRARSFRRLTRPPGERNDGLSSAAERFAAELEGEAAEAAPEVASRAAELSAAESRLAQLQARIDALYCDTFVNIEVPGVYSEPAAEAEQAVPLSEADFAQLGRDSPAAFARLMAAAARDRVRFNKFQAEAQQLSLRRDAARREVNAASAALVAAQRALYRDEKEAPPSDVAAAGTSR